jgi:hypothetical protein
MTEAVGVEDEPVVADALVGREQRVKARGVLGGERRFGMQVPDVNAAWCEMCAQRAAVIELTWMVLVFASSVPTTATF